MRKRSTADTTVIGRVIYIGVVSPRTVAIAIAPKLTCDRPSPIIEYLLRTSDTPRRAAETDIRSIAINA